MESRYIVSRFYLIRHWQSPSVGRTFCHSTKCLILYHFVLCTWCCFTNPSRRLYIYNIYICQSIKINKLLHIYIYICKTTVNWIIIHVWNPIRLEACSAKPTGTVCLFTAPFLTCYYTGVVYSNTVIYLRFNINVHLCIRLTWKITKVVKKHSFIEFWRKLQLQITRNNRNLKINNHNFTYFGQFEINFA